MDSKLLFNQIKLQMPNINGVTIKAEDDKLNFYVDGKKEFYVRPSGGVSFEVNCSDTDKVKQVSDMAMKTSRYVSEYITAIENAPKLNVDGLANGFKLLAQFNNTVLAARFMQNENLEFVTWDKDVKGVSAGHYYGNNYTGAKEDFASRAGLVNPDKIFSDKELAEIYRCTSDTLDGGFEISDTQREMIGNIRDKIKVTLPNLDQLIEESYQEYQEFEQTMQ